MGKGCTNEYKNVYMRARKNASAYNERLSSREGAAELLGVSPSTLADYELGTTKFVPVDKVVLMADLYNCPELKTGYCKHECPIGAQMPLATEASDIDGVVLRLLSEFDIERMNETERRLMEIAKDGRVSKDEKPELKELVDGLDALSFAISELKIAAEKALSERRQ